MFLIRLAFWVGLVVMLLPSDERQQARLYDTAVATVEHITTFCDRRGDICAAGSDAWASFLRKAEFGARILVSLATSQRERAPAAESSADPLRSDARGRPAFSATSGRGTLKPEDLTPPWHGGQVRRTAQRSGS